jgi:hypothetical protein
LDNAINCPARPSQYFLLIGPNRLLRQWSALPIDSEPFYAEGPELGFPSECVIQQFLYNGYICSFVRALQSDWKLNATRFRYHKVDALIVARDESIRRSVTKRATLEKILSFRTISEARLKAGGESSREHAPVIHGFTGWVGR